MSGLNDLVVGALALVGIVIVAMALSANKTGARIVQMGLLIAIIAVLLRNRSDFLSAWTELTRNAIATTQKQIGSGGNRASESPGQTGTSHLQ